MGNNINSKNSNMFIIDRFEADVIVLENQQREMIFITKNDIMGKFNEGDVVYKKNDKYFIDIQATEERKSKMKNLMKGIWVD